MTAAAGEFTTEGFDLDALPSSGNTEEEVIYEVGGGASINQKPPQKSKDDKTDGKEEETAKKSGIALAEDLKAQGNEAFKSKDYLEAFDMYSSAIEACPGMKGPELLTLRDAFDDKERAKMYERNRLKRDATTGKRQSAKEQGENSEEAPPPPPPPPTNSAEQEQTPPMEEFAAPPHEHGEQLAVYYCNRAASLLYLNRFDECISDCDVAILLNSQYAKAYVRRSMAYEKTDQTDKALGDAKKALALDPKNVNVRKTTARLQKIEDERLEKLKEETMGKLKDLGNSLLGNFGLSMDNFKTVQDPNTGSYSISFEQSPNK